MGLAGPNWALRADSAGGSVQKATHGQRQSKSGLFFWGLPLALIAGLELLRKASQTGLYRKRNCFAGTGLMNKFYYYSRGQGGTLGRN